LGLASPDNPLAARFGTAGLVLQGVLLTAAALIAIWGLYYGLRKLEPACPSPRAASCSLGNACSFTVIDATGQALA